MTAAAAKCVENVYRDVNIALVNELRRGVRRARPRHRGRARRRGDQVERAAVRARLVGGSCLPTDPHLLADRLFRGGQPAPVRLARATNEAVPERIAALTVDALAVRYDRWLEGEHQATESPPTGR